jgi:hypothetical protein
VAEDLSSMAAAGPETTIANIMPKKPKKEDPRKQKLIQVVELLKFLRTIDDEEIVTSTIESIIELLEEEIDK